MNELRALLSLELRSLYGINQFLYTRDRKARNRYYLLLGAWVIVIAMVVFYVGGLTYGLCILGLGEIAPAYLTVIASALILFFGIFTAGNRIFGRKGYDILASMPLKATSLVASRFLSLYVEDLLLTLLILLPGVGVYGACMAPKGSFYLFAALGALLIPAIPLVISTLVGTVILGISSRMKRKSLVQTLLMVLLVVGVMAGSFSMGSASEHMTAADFSNLAVSISGLLGSVYPPALWLGEAMIRGSLGQFGLFALLSLAVMLAALWLVSRYFHGILRRLGSFTARHDYKIGAMEHRSLLKALYLRETKRYFSSSVYVTNTIIGPIMGAILAAALCFTDPASIQGVLPVDVPGLLPFVFGAVFCTMTTTAVSISMEGKQFWVIKSLPIPTKTLLDSKILLNLSLMLPFYLVSVAAMAIGTRADFWELVWLALIPGSVILFSVVVGITVNLKFHSFDWEKEERVVKQSASSMLGGFAGPLLSLLLGGAVFRIPAQFGGAVRALACLLVLILTALLYRKNNQTELNRL